MKRVLTYTESYVKEMYTSIGILQPHQLDFRTIANRLGVHIFYWNESSQALFFKDKGYIMLNEQNSSPEQFQSFCHELAHVLLHTGSQKKLPKLFIEYQEHKANQFMYHAAMPTFMMDQLDMSLSVNDLANLFNVEVHFAHHRLNHYIEQRMSNWNTYNYSFAVY